MKNFCKVIVLAFLCVFCTMPKLVVKAESNYKEISVKDAINVDKQWTVVFNKEIDKKTVNKDNVIVKDSNNNVISTELKLIDNKRISVKTVKNYEYGKKYTLITNKGIKSVDGKLLNEGIKMNFNTKSQQAKYTVCINAARGGSDNGSIGSSGLKEKDVNLDVALKLGNLLGKENINVIYTRNSDKVSFNSKSDIEERIKISNNASADVLINIMCNSSEAISSKGIETYYAKNISEGKDLASKIQESLIKTVKPISRGIKEGEFNSLKLSKAPAALVTLGFITNKDEEKLLKTTEYKEKLALSISEGVKKYLSITSNNTENNTNNNNTNNTNNNNTNNNSNTENNNTGNGNGDTPDGTDKIYYEVIEKSIKQNDSFELPEKLSISKNGLEEEVEVKWKNYDIDTSNYGTKRIEGIIKDNNKEILLILTILKEPSKGKYKVVLDPGHGGNDSGAVGVTGLKEKDVVLSMALKVGKILTQNGVDVVYTRTTDDYSMPRDQTQNLQYRCDIANREKPNCFVSIHANAADASSANGIETFYFKSSLNGSKLAQGIQDELISYTGRRDRGIKTNGLYVTRNVDTTSVLVETGFLSNAEEEKLLKSDEYRNKCIKAIATGILKNLGINNIKYD